MTTIQPKFGFLLRYVDDIEPAKQFYSQALGLKVERTSPVFVQFEHFAIASDESLSGTRQDELYWVVEDAQAAYAELSRSAEISLPLQQKPFGKVFGVKDPNGSTLYFVEFATQRPSQAPG